MLQPNEQASSSVNQLEMGGTVSQSGTGGADDLGSRSQEGDWRQMRPDQSHSPTVSGAVNPASPPGKKWWYTSDCDSCSYNSFCEAHFW